MSLNPKDTFYDSILPLNAMILVVGWVITDSAVIGRRIMSLLLAKSMITTWFWPFTCSRTHTNRSDSKVSVWKPTLAALTPNACSYDKAISQKLGDPFFHPWQNLTCASCWNRMGSCSAIACFARYSFKWLVSAQRSSQRYKIVRWDEEKGQRLGWLGTLGCWNLTRKLNCRHHPWTESWARNTENHSTLSKITRDWPSQS